MWVVLNDAEVIWPLPHPSMTQSQEATVNNQYVEVTALIYYTGSHAACYVFLST